MRILIVAPYNVGIDTGFEIGKLATGHQIMSLTGTVDRAKLELALGNAQYDAVHISCHGKPGILTLSDGDIEAADLLSMLEGQRHLRFLVLNVCESAALGIALHNHLHVPVVAQDDAIGVAAAFRFTETFYRALKSTSGNITEAFERGLQTLQKAFPDYARTPQLINGDMITAEKLNLCLEGVADRLQEMATTLQRFDRRLISVETTVNYGLGTRRIIERITVAALVLLLIAQLITPWLNNALR